MTPCVQSSNESLDIFEPAFALCLRLRGGMFHAARGRQDKEIPSQGRFQFAQVVFCRWCFGCAGRGWEWAWGMRQAGRSSGTEGLTLGRTGATAYSWHGKGVEYVKLVLMRKGQRMLCKARGRPLGTLGPQDALKSILQAC
jgi:hypothetical protein